MERDMESKRLLGSSDSEDGFSIYSYRFSTTKKKKYQIEFKQVVKIVKSGNLDEIRNTLKKQNIQLAGADGLTVLHVAAAGNHKEALSLLLEDQRCSALLNRQDKEGVTPLLAAVLVGSYDTLELLCAQGADPCKTLCKNGRNVLHLAARRCDIRAAEIVLKYNSSPKLINALNDNGDTPLIEAVFVKAKVLDLLFKAGADITIQNPENGRTLLHVVVAYNRVSLLKEVLKHPQATVDYAEIKDMKDDTALFIAVKLDKLEMVTILLNTFHNLTGINDFDHESVFHITVRHDKVEILKVLINSGCMACINYIDLSFRTPLLYAAELDRASCLQELIENGADYNLRNSCTGETFVHVIARKLSYFTLPYVMSITDIAWFFTQVDLQGNTPYMTAIMNGNAHFLHEALQIKQVDLCDENSEGEPPVYYTAKHGHFKTMMTLLMSPRYYYFVNSKKKAEKLSDPNEITKLEMRGDLYATDVYLLHGKVIKHPLVPWFPTALLRRTRENQNIFHACALGGSLECLIFLHGLFSSFEPKYLDEMFDKADLMGNTPLLFAAQCGVASIPCVHFFVTHGADMASVNFAGLNVFNATLTYNPEVAESLITSLLDSCVTGKREHYYEDRMNINLNFSILCPKKENLNQMRVVYMLFHEMTSYDSIKAKRKVLQHPVIELFLKNKYQTQKHYLIFRFLVLLAITIGMSFFIPIVYIGDNPENKYRFLTPFIQKTLNLIFFFISFIPTFFKIPNLLHRRVWPTDAIAFIPFITMATLMCFGRTFVLAPELTAITILSCWIYVMVFLTTLYHTYSFQLAVFFQILNSISKHLLVLTVSMFAFALSFFCIYRDDTKFSSFPTSLIYTFIVLLLGYFPDMPTFDKEYFTTTPITFHFLVECFLLSAFTLMIVLGFINMLVGLAVRSANVAELDGKVYQHHQQAHILFMIESWFNNRLYFWFLKKGIFPEILKKLRDNRRINLNVGLYDETLKNIIDDSSIRQFRSIVFQQKRLSETLDDSKSIHSFGDTLYSWIQNKYKYSTPSHKTLIRRQAQWDEERSSQSFEMEFM